MSTKIQFIALSLAIAGGFAHAHDLDYLQQIKIPEELAPVGTLQTERSTYYLKTPNAFSPQVLATQESRLKLPPGKVAPSIYVSFKSAAVSTAIADRLKLRGIRLAETKDDADLVLNGDVLYTNHYYPNVPSKIVLNEQFDSKQATSSKIEDQPNKTVTLAAIELTPAYLTRGLSASAFGASAMMAFFDVTGLSKAFSEAKTQEEKRAESYLPLDCFDKGTRKASSCMSDGQRLLSYRGKVRVQAVDIKAYLICKFPGCGEVQRARIITRELSDRTSTDITLPDLLSETVNELVSLMGSPNLVGHESPAQGTTPKTMN